MSVDGITRTGDHLLTLGEEEEVEALLDSLELAVSLLAMSVAAHDKGLIEEAAGLFDEVIYRLKDHMPEDAARVIGYPLVDALELVECLGGEAVIEALAYAVRVLMETPTEEPVKLIEVYSDCLGWEGDPQSLPPTVIAGAILASFTAALNKTILSL